MEKLDESFKMIAGIRVKTEKRMLEELNERERKYKDGSKDGYVEVGNGDFTYREVNYNIKILRYFNLFPSKFKTLGSQRISSMHAVIEFPKETKELVDDYSNIMDSFSEFLYHDTLHPQNDKQTIEEQVKACHDLAKSDIDGIPELIDSKEQKLREFKKKYPKLIKHHTPWGDIK